MEIKLFRLVEVGVLITNNNSLATRARHLSTTAKICHPWNFEHDEIAWNDRLPNINAALGASQMEVLEERLANKRKLYEKYIIYSKIWLV